MEIGEQSADHAKLESGIDKQIAVAAPCFHASSKPGSVFQSADRGRSNRNDSPHLVERLIDFSRCVFGNVVALGMQFVFFDDFLSHWLECSQANVQSNFSGFNA